MPKKQEGPTAGSDPAEEEELFDPDSSPEEEDLFRRDSTAGYTDPFDVAALKESPPFDFEIKSVLSGVPVRKPTSDEYFRVHPGKDFVFNAPLLDRTNCPERGYYWVAPIMRDELSNETRVFRLATCYSKRGHVFVWPIKIPKGDTNIGRSWFDSALEVTDIGSKSWIRIQGDQPSGGYLIYIARGNLAAPDWPELTHEGIIRAAFKGRVIDTAEHPVVRDLRGEI